jgi:hypothetical protein
MSQGTESKNPFQVAWSALQKRKKNVKRRIPFPYASSILVSTSPPTPAAILLQFRPSGPVQKSLVFSLTLTTVLSIPSFPPFFTS